MSLILQTAAVNELRDKHRMLSTDGNWYTTTLLEMERTNLHITSEPSTLAGWAQAGVSLYSGGWGAFGLANGFAFGDNSTLRYAYRTAPPINTLCALSVFIEMDDGNAPVVGGTTNTGDFCLILAGGIMPAANLRTEKITETLYRVWGFVTTGGTSSSSTGVVKYTTQSARTFRVTGFQVEAGRR
jgi:hypothetical protein